VFSLPIRYPIGTKRHHESSKPESCQSKCCCFFFFFYFKITWIYHTSFHTKQQHFTVTSTWPHCFFRSSKLHTRRMKPRTQEVCFHLGCCFHILYTYAKKGWFSIQPPTSLFSLHRYYLRSLLFVGTNFSKFDRY